MKASDQVLTGVHPRKAGMSLHPLLLFYALRGTRSKSSFRGAALRNWHGQPDTPTTTIVPVLPQGVLPLLHEESAAFHSLPDRSTSGQQRPEQQHPDGGFFPESG
jgi:hypothetical protein